MTTVTLPLSKDSFIPALPKIPLRELNWMGRIIRQIHDARNHGIIYKVFVYTLVIFISFFLVVSIVLSPLFIYGFKEYVRQGERIHYDKKYKELLQIAQEHGRQSFLRGRIAPLDTPSIRFGWLNSPRKQIIKDLELEPNEAKDLSDTDLVRKVAVKYDDFLQRYHLKISG